MMKTKYGGYNNFKPGEKITFAIPYGADGPWDGPRHRNFYDGIIIKGNSVIKIDNLHYTYDIKDENGNVQTVLAKEIWSRHTKIPKGKR